MTVPICKDCIFHSPFKYTGYKGTFDRCTFKPKIDPVTGEKEYKYCSTERINDLSCSIRGKHFVSKDAKTFAEPEKPVSFWSKLKFW